jgi:hypothetical protein
MSVPSMLGALYILRRVSFSELARPSRTIGLHHAYRHYK